MNSVIDKLNITPVKKNVLMTKKLGMNNRPVSKIGHYNGAPMSKLGCYN